jgi:hypothetical protein
MLLYCREITFEHPLDIYFVSYKESQDFLKKKNFLILYNKVFYLYIIILKCLDHDSAFDDRIMITTHLISIYQISTGLEY